MSDPNGTHEARPGGDEPTDPQVPVTAGPYLGATEDDEAVFAALAGGRLEGDEAWPSRARRSGVRLRLPTLILLALVVAAGAFWGGAEVQKQDGTTPASSSLSSFASRIASALGRAQSGAGSGSGFAGLGGAAPAAAGTVTAVVGSTLYVTTSSGTIVQVELSPSTTIDRDAKASPSGLHSGDTVVVEGTTSGKGVVKATSVAATAKGVSPATGRLGAGGGFAGAGGFGGSGGFGGAGGGSGGGFGGAGGAGGAPVKGGSGG